jgi:cob(I)alamin adenosyltransferase
MKKSLLYTGGGDRGMTSLASGQRVPKTHLRLEAYGTVDELNAFIGLLITEVKDRETAGLLQFIQHKLFAVGASLATEGAAASKPACRITPDNVLRIEQSIDRIDAGLPRMKGFILPGGNRPAALAQVCRTVCRRVERQICRLAEAYRIEEETGVFINRLSDLLFVIARKECMSGNDDEILWDNACD